MSPSSRNEPVGAALAFSVADAWIGPVIAQQLEPLGCGAVDEGLAVLQCALWFGVDAEVPVRMLEEHDIAGRDVAGDEEVGAARQFVRDMAWGMTACLDRPLAGDNLVAGPDPRQSVLDGGQITLCPTPEVMR